MAYIEGFVAAVPRGNKDAYQKHAAGAVSFFKEFGATRQFEAWGDDVPDGKLTDFKGAVQARPDEVPPGWHIAAGWQRSHARGGRRGPCRNSQPTRRGIDLIAQLTTTERRQSAIILLAVGMVGIAMAALGRSDPLGVHGLLVILYCLGLAYFVLSSFYDPEPETDREGHYYDDPIKVGIALSMAWAVFGLFMGVWVAAQLAWPSLAFDAAWSTFGRMRPSSAKPRRSSSARPASRTDSCESECTSSTPNSRSTICTPGFTSVDLTAMSTTRNTSLPGASSTYSCDIPATGMSPAVTVPKYAAYCGCMRSMKKYARSCRLLSLDMRAPYLSGLRSAILLPGKAVRGTHRDDLRSYLSGRGDVVRRHVPLRESVDGDLEFVYGKVVEDESRTTGYFLASVRIDPDGLIAAYQVSFDTELSLLPDA